MKKQKFCALLCAVFLMSCVHLDVWAESFNDENATWGELCRHFQSEWFDSLPDEVQAEYDQLLLNEIPPKREDSENPETGREEAAIRSEGAEGYSVYVVDEGAMTLPQSKVPEGIITLMMGLRAEKEAVGYRVSTFCDQEGAQVFLMVALMDAQTGEYLAVQPYSSAIDRMYQTEEAFAMKKNVLPYLPQIDDLEKHISVYNDLGLLYRQHQMNDSPLYYYNKALDSALQYGDESWIAHICNNVSILYFNIRQLDEAEKYTDMATEHAARTEDPFVAFTTWQIRATIKAELNKLDDAEKSNRKAWNIACHGEGNEDLWKIRCLPGMLRLFERKEQPDSIDHYLKLGNKLVQRVPSNSIAAIGFIQSRAATETNRKNYARALKDFHWLRNRKTGTEPKTLFTQMARCYDALGNPKLAYTYMDSARMWTDTLAQHNLTQQMAEFNVKYHTQEKELEIAHLQQEQLEHQAFLLKASIAVALLSGLALITLLTLRHKKRIAEKKIELLKQENELNSARRYIEGLEEECKYFAKELHDGIANDLLGLQMKIEASAGKGNEQELASLVSKLRNNVRNISHELMPPEFEHLSLDQILDRYAAKLTENTGIEVSYHPTENNASRHLPNETAYELYRIVQELTMNIVKHASASHIVISLRADNENKYTLQITDNGKNANKQQTATNNNDGIGLRTVNDRIRAINATANVCSSTENNVFTLLLNINE